MLIHVVERQEVAISSCSVTQLFLKDLSSTSFPWATSQLVSSAPKANYSSSKSITNKELLVFRCLFGSHSTSFIFIATLMINRRTWCSSPSPLPQLLWILYIVFGCELTSADERSWVSMKRFPLTVRILYKLIMYRRQTLRRIAISDIWDLHPETHRASRKHFHPKTVLTFPLGSSTRFSHSIVNNRTLAIQALQHTSWCVLHLFDSRTDAALYRLLFRMRDWRKPWKIYSRNNGFDEAYAWCRT